VLGRKKKQTNQNKKKTPMHDTVCTLVMQTNAHNELKNNKTTYTHFNAKKKASMQQTQIRFFLYIYIEVEN